MVQRYQDSFPVVALGRGYRDDRPSNASHIPLEIPFAFYEDQNLAVPTGATSQVWLHAFCKILFPVQRNRRHNAFSAKVNRNIRAHRPSKCPDGFSEKDGLSPTWTPQPPPTIPHPPAATTHLPAPFSHADTSARPANMRRKVHEWAHRR